jgi:hypothetical protein
MDEQVRHVLRAGAKTEDGENLRLGVDGQPEPEHLFGAAQPGAQFVQVNEKAEEKASKDAKEAPDRGRPRARTRRHERPYNPRHLK